MSRPSVVFTNRTQADHDATTAWALVGNVPDGEDARVSDQPVRGLVIELRADLARIEAALAVARERLVTTPEVRRARRAVSIVLLERARALVIEAGAYRAERRRERLIARLGGGPVKPYRQGLAHRHSWPRTALRRLDPQWWAARRDAWDRVRIECHRPAGPGVGQHKVTLRQGGIEIGTATCTVCTTCTVACIDEIDIRPDCEGRGLGSGLLRRLRDELPGYRWCTTPQRETALSFWRRLQRAYPGEYFDGTNKHGLLCSHLAARYY